MDTLLLTDDQRLRLALLDRCLPVAGVQAVPMAEDAYAFVVRGLAEAEAAPAPPAMPTAHTAIALVPAPSMPVEKIDMDARACASESVEPAQALPVEPEPAVSAPTALERMVRDAVAAILRIQGAGEPVTQKSISGATCIPEGSMSRVLNQAVKMGLLEITGPKQCRVYTVLAPSLAPPLAERLRGWVADGATLPMMKASLGLPTDRVLEMLAEHGLAGIDSNGDFCSPNGDSAVAHQTSPAKRRSCLRCGASFLSSGPGHRLCASCRKLSSDLEGR